MNFFRLIILIFVIGGGGPAIFATPKDFQSVYQLAIKLAKQKEYDNAIRYFKYLVKLQPSNVKVKFLMAKAHYFNSEMSSAFKICKAIKDPAVTKKCDAMFEKAKREHPKAYKYFQAWNQFHQKKFEDSEKLVRELLKEDLDNPRYRMLLGKIFQGQGWLDRSMNQYLYVLDYVSRKNRRKVKKLIKNLSKQGDELVEYVNNNQPEQNAYDDFMQVYYLGLRLKTRSFDPEAKQYGEKLTYHLQQLVDLGNKPNLDELHFAAGFVYALLNEPKKSRQSYKLAREHSKDEVRIASINFMLEELEKKFPQLPQD